jgi:hypothetical protein
MEDHLKSGDHTELEETQYVLIPYATLRYGARPLKAEEIIIIIKRIGFLGPISLVVVDGREDF